MVAGSPMWTDVVSTIFTAIGALGFVAAAIAAWFAYDAVGTTGRKPFP
jgi:hypothetical protein